MAATRIRKTFHYPDSDDEETVEAGLDAQDQQTILTTLQINDTSSTRIYTLLLLIFPVSIALLTLPGLFRISTVIPSLLALASLVGSAYTLYFLPLPPRSLGLIVGEAEFGKGKVKGEKSIGEYELKTDGLNERQVERREAPYLSVEVQELLGKYIVPGNAVVCALMVLFELARGREWRDGMLIGGGYIPALVLTVILWARKELRVVDMRDLQRLQSW